MESIEEVTVPIADNNPSTFESFTFPPYEDSLVFQDEPPPLIQKSDPPKKPFGVSKKTITFDSAVIPANPPHTRYISLTASAPLPNLPTVEEVDVERPIHSSGFYNLGDDIEFDEPPKRTRITVPRRPTKPPKPIAPKVQSRSKTLELPRSSIAVLSEKLRSSEWSDQNDAITELIETADQISGQLQTNLNGLIESLLECAASPRSALAKNALNCLSKWFASKEISFDSVSERCASALLSLVISQHDKHFLADLAGHCFAVLIAGIPVAKAVGICLNEYRRKHEVGRLQVATAMIEIVPRMNDCSVFLKPLIVLVKDKNPNVRRAAKEVIGSIRQHVGDFTRFVMTNISSEDKRLILLRDIRCTRSCQCLN
jgi:hypothetical protein